MFNITKMGPVLGGIVGVRVRFSSNFESVPSPRGLPLIGTTLSLILAGGPAKLHKYMDGRHKELGPIFKDNVGPVEAVFLADPVEMRNVFAKEGKYPQHIKPESWLIYNKKHDYSRGLFFMDGPEWQHYRKTMNKILLKGDLSWIENSCDVATNLFINKIKEQENKEFPELEHELYKWSMDMILSVLIGDEAFNNTTKDINELTDDLAKVVYLVFENTCKLQLIPAKLAEKYGIKRWIQFEESVTKSLKLANELLMKLKCLNSNGLLRKMQDEKIDSSFISRIIIDLILSAGDTTAYTMSWVLYLISTHKNIQQQLRENLIKDSKSSYLRNTLKETLRLYPVAPFLTRFLPEDSVICGYRIPAQTLIVMSIYTSGRCSKYFKKPEVFDPNRWSREAEIGEYLKQQQATLPFGIGARSCIGRKIAETQLQMTLKKVVVNYDVDIMNGNEIDDILKMVSKPSKPLRLIFNKL